MKTSNIKFVRYNESQSAKTPMETMSPGRVYVTVNAKNELTSVTYYDEDGKRRKQIDLTHPHNQINGPHVHHGYLHAENGTTRLSVKEKKLIEFVKKTWLNNLNK